MSLVPLVSKNRRNEEKRNIIVVNFEVLAGIRREVKRKTEERKGREKIRCRFEKFACRWKLYFFWWIHLPVSLGRRGKRARIGRVAAVFPIKIQGKPFSHGCAFLIHRDGGICGNVGRNLEALLASFDRVRIASPRAIRANSNYILYIYRYILVGSFSLAISTVLSIVNYCSNLLIQASLFALQHYCLCF